MSVSSSRTRLPAARTGRGTLVVVLLAALAAQVAYGIGAHAATTVAWVWSGALTSTSVVVKARTSAESPSVRLLVSRTPDLAAPLATRAQPATAATDRVVTLPVAGLAPATRYHYGVEVDGVVDPAKRGTFRTAPDGAGSFTIAFGSCASTGSDHPVFDAIRAADPLFMVHTGDLHYEDIATADTSLFRAAYDRVLASPRQSALYRSVPLAYMWDDHDYGPNNADGTSPTKAAARTAYRERVPHHPLAAGSGDVAPYQAFTVGRVRFLVTDGRSERSPSGAKDDAAKTMLGAAQKAWLKAELLAARDAQALTVWVNTIPWVADVKAGGDNWGGYTTERREIADFIRDSRIDRTLVMLSGDAHMLSAEDGTNSGYATGGGGGFPVLHAAALDRPGSVKGGPYSHGAFPGGGQFGLLSVQDTGGSEVTVSYSGRRSDGAEVVRLGVTVGDHLDRAPTIAAITPLDGALGVPLGTDVTARFSEPLDPASVTGATFTLSPASTAGATSGPVPAVVSLDAAGTTARLDPTGDLAPGTTYTARLSGVRDRVGTPAPDRTWTLATAAETVRLVPVADAHVTSAAPSANAGTATSLRVDGNPTEVTYLRYDLSPYAGRDLVRASLGLRVTSNASADRPTVRGVADDAWTETGLTYANRPSLGSTALGTLGSTTVDTSHAVDLTASAVAAELGGALGLAVAPAGTDGLLLASRETATPPVLTLAFGPAAAPADATAPVLTAGTPLDGTTGVSATTTVTVTASEPLDPRTVTPSTFTLVPAGAGTTAVPVTAAVSLDAAGTTATLDPASDLPPGTTWTASVSGVRDLAGNTAPARSWSFTTAPLTRTVTLVPTADTYASGGASTSNFGTATDMRVDNSPVDVAYLKYDLTPYAGRALTAASLALQVTSNGSGDKPTVRPVGHDGWTETGLTYATRPAVGTTVLGTLGATTAGRAYTVTLTPGGVAGEVGGTLTLAVVSPGTDGLRLASRETATPPRLTLTFG